MSDRTDWLTFELGLFAHDPSEWVLLTGDRILVCFCGVVVLAAGAALAVLSGLVPLRAETPVLFLLFALIAANFTLIAIVASLSQFVLSRRLQSPGEIMTRIDETIAYREEVGKTLDQRVMPVKPDAFFLILFEHVRERLESIDELSSDATTNGGRERAPAELDELVGGLGGHAEYVVHLLRSPSSELKHALFVSLNTEYENYVHRTWYLQTEYGEEFSEELIGPLEQLTETLEHVVVASRLFRTTFIESEVSELSRVLLYVGLPVQLLAVLTMAVYSGVGSTPSVSRPVVRVLVPAVLVGGFTPFVLLCSYIVRLTIVARRTADNFPFSSQLESTVDADRADH
jgi:hypothetical protein